MSSTPFNPNSQMAFDLFMQERQRHYGTTEGGISRGQMGQGQRYRAPSAGIYQNWGGGEQYAGASRSGHSFSADLSRATAGLRGMATNYMGGMQSRAQQRAQQRTQAIQNWQGTYQQASSAAQTAGMRNQMVQSMTTPAPSTNLSSPMAQIQQNISRMSQQARQASSMTDLSSPTAQINQNLAAMSRQAQEKKQTGQAMWQGAYQQGAQAAQAQQWRNQMTAALTKDVRLK